MPLTPPPDGTATYGAPLTLTWGAPDFGVSAAVSLPQEIIETLADDELAAIIAVVDGAMVARFPGWRLVRSLEWSFATRPASTDTTIQEGQDVE